MLCPVCRKYLHYKRWNQKVNGEPAHPECVIVHEFTQRILTGLGKAKEDSTPAKLGDDNWEFVRPEEYTFDREKHWSTKRFRNMQNFGREGI